MTENPICKVPHLNAQWFHAIDCPILDPIAVRKAKRERSSIAITSEAKKAEIASKNAPKNWVPFSKRDNIALEKAYQSHETNLVPVNEDYLFDVNISKREISPVYWEGPIYPVRRATWFMQTDGLSKWLPCDENLSNQIEQGYLKHRPYAKPTKSAVEASLNQETATKRQSVVPPEKENSIQNDKSKPEVHIEEKENLLGPYLGQYVIYTSPTQAWLLEDTTGGKIARSFFTTITNNQNLGGIKLLRGHQEVKNESNKKNEENMSASKNAAEKPPSDDQDATKLQSENVTETRDIPTNSQSPSEQNEDTKRLAEDYENEESEEEMREIDQVVFVIHGIGQQMSERMGQNFVHDVNVLRKTMKSTWPIAVSGISSLDRANGIQVLPILWRKSILFGTQDNEETGDESDLGTVSDGDDGCPTIDEITLDGAPNIRTLVSDVFLDIPLYLTSKYHDLMIQVVTKEVNRVYQLFVERNPLFIKNNGQITILAHSLGSLLAFDILTSQPLSQIQKSNMKPPSETKKQPSLSFPVKNFFAVGSPLGMILLLRSNKIVSRKALENATPLDDNKSAVTFVYPAVDSIYNIFHKSDPVAYRLEPLVVRYHASKLKPVPIAYIKGGLKSVIDASFHVGNDLANKANAMIESFKSGFTNSVLMRGFGFSSNVAPNKEVVNEELQIRSKSDPAIVASKAEAKSAAKLEQLNPHHGRLDFCLQEGLLENAYISALSVHMSYWQDVDVAGFLIREIYREAGKC